MPKPISKGRELHLLFRRHDLGQRGDAHRHHLELGLKFDAPRFAVVAAPSWNEAA